MAEKVKKIIDRLVAGQYTGNEGSLTARCIQQTLYELAMMINRFEFGAQEHALAVMKASAQHLVAIGKALWAVERINEKIFLGLEPDEIVVGYQGDMPIATMLLTKTDPEYWPTVPMGESRFVHKLAVIPQRKGIGLGHQMLQKAVEETRRWGATYVRLDCAGDRPGLCQFYEEFGFHKVAEGTVGPYFTAFYELKI